MSAQFCKASSALDPGAVLATIEQCDLAALRLHWRNHLGLSAPAHLPRWLLMRILAYRLQVILHGDLSAETRRLLGITNGRHRSGRGQRASSAGQAGAGSHPDNMLPNGHSNPSAHDTSSKGIPAFAVSAAQAPSSGSRRHPAFVKRAAVTRDGQHLDPGSILAREWDGTMQRVMVGENGQFIFNGKAYGSLSQIAKLITGTDWNGHRFFGLKKGRTSAGKGRTILARPNPYSQNILRA